MIRWPTCQFCFEDASFTITLSKGREFDVCNNIYCIGRIAEICKEEKDDRIHDIKLIDLKDFD